MARQRVSRAFLSNRGIHRNLWLHEDESSFDGGNIMNEIIKMPAVNQGSAERQNKIDVVGDSPVPEETTKMMSDLMIQKEYINKIVGMADLFSNSFPKDK